MQDQVEKMVLVLHSKMSSSSLMVTCGEGCCPRWPWNWLGLCTHFLARLLTAQAETSAHGAMLVAQVAVPRNKTSPR